MEVTRSVIIGSVESVNTDSVVSPEEYAESIRETMAELGMKDVFVSVADSPKIIGYKKGE